jgi:hypothetical protein
MNLEKIKRKIAEGHTDAEIASMSGLPVKEVAKLRAPANPGGVKFEGEGSPMAAERKEAAKEYANAPAKIKERLIKAREEKTTV